ncbi:hypothetical protein [Variovorax sp. CY25R-8]|uniref:AtuA-related protein n=1 Tax=Variovorax sp. CY25R-8 TaxID=2855501 RepID=UPI0021BB943F|nr:hypothetical protein [Variovorax sp. CY25R-8]MCT8176745.1 hypothetical protein [Variovorax sp. CY25R-8]
MQIPLRYLAHSRSGDKGNIFNVGVFAYEPAFHPYLVEQLTAEKVKAFYKVAERVDRHVADNIHGMNFVLHGALAGGVSRTLALDNYGKAMSSVILRIDIEVPPDIERLVRRRFPALPAATGASP